MKVGHVPLIAYRRPGDPGAMDEITQRMAAFAVRGTPIRAVMQERLGPTVWSASLAQASAVLEELEETARLWLLSNPKPAPLTPEQIEALRREFGAIW